MADYTLTFGSDVVTSYTEVTNNAQSAMGASAAEDRIGEASFNGSNHSSITFECLVTPTFATTGTVSLRLYDVGPVSGPPTVGRLVATLATTTSGGPQRLTQTLAAVASGPGTNEILQVDRMYQVTAEVDATTGDDCYIGWVSLVGVGGGSVAITSDPTAIHKNIDAEISAISAKGTPTSSDFLLIEDAADSNSKKSITIGDLPSGGGGTSDGRGFSIVIGNSLEGDTSDICDYLDVGDGAQLKAGIEAAAGNPVYIRPGTYDFNNGAATTNLITVPDDTVVTGASKTSVIIRTLSQSTVESTLLLLGSNTEFQDFTVSIPTPTGTTSSSYYSLLQTASGSTGYTKFRRVKFEFEDNGWSTLVNASWVPYDAILYDYDIDEIHFLECDFLYTPTDRSTPVGQVYYVAGIASYSNPERFVFNHNFIDGGYHMIDTSPRHMEARSNFYVNFGCLDNWAYPIYYGSPFSGDPPSSLVSDNTFGFLSPNANNEIIGVYAFPSFGVRVVSNKFLIVLDGAYNNAKAIRVDSDECVVALNEDVGSEPWIHWFYGASFASDTRATFIGNNFDPSSLFHANSGIGNLIFEGNSPSYNPALELDGRHANLWSYAHWEDIIASSDPMTFRKEFTTDSLLTGVTTDTAGATAYHITSSSAGTLSANTVDVFDTAFNSGTAVRYQESPNTRRSWSFLQAPASGDEFFMYWGGLSFKSTAKNQAIVGRLKFLQRLTPVAADARIGLMLMNRASFAPDPANRLAIVLSDTTGGSLVASFEKVDAGTPSTIGSTANVGAEGQALEHASIFYDDGTSTFHGFVGTTGGNWIYLGATTMTAAAFQYGGIYLQNSSVVAPGVAVGAVDFIRTYDTSNFLF